MKSKFFKINIILLTLIIILSGCSSIEQKLGFKNNSFEYIKNGTVDKIVIKNSRDKGFTFVITDQNKLKNLYNIFSSANKTSSKTSLDSDYVIEIHELPDTVHKFNYIIGLSKGDGGNFYSEDEAFYVSSRLENDVFSYFEDYRKPKDFNIVYYDTIVKALDKFNEDSGNKAKVTLNIRDDVDIQKFLTSVELRDFSKRAEDKLEVIDSATDSGEFIMKVDTLGYLNTTDNNEFTSMYKAVITFTDSKTSNIKKYYVYNTYEDSKWKYKIMDKLTEDMKEKFNY
ncbi:MAG: hypothetical protein AB6733_12975 [Clostridiaceae bacterium]